jgi:SAM-dependent methyltransferase
MLSAAARRANYDSIAHLYDVDMARNMPFDDIAFYVERAAAARGRVLELGCGNGRVLLALLEGGIDAIGVDCSPGMLEELRRKAPLGGGAPMLCLMDARQLAFRNAFAMVLCPYSLITYMTGVGDDVRMLKAIHEALVPGGRVIVDAFVPRANVYGSQFAIDYRRAIGDAFLTRFKRVVRVAPGLNRIERRYELATADGTVMHCIQTREDVCPLTPGDLLQRLADCGFEPEQQWWDYAPNASRDSAQFFTVSARRRSAMGS